MEIRTATKDDLLRIMELGNEFGHLMLYQKDLKAMEACLPRILVALETYDEGGPGWVHNDNPPDKEIVGYYHYIVSSDPGFEEMLTCYRQFPEEAINEASEHIYRGTELCVCMQGASHREVFREFIKYLQERYNEIWCYCSKKSQRPQTYTELGFTFDLLEEHTFWNCNKGDYSTYKLGRWKKWQ